MDTDSQTKLLEAQLRDLYGRAVWTHKTQEKCADIILRRHSRLKLVQIALSALTTTGILIAVFGQARGVGIASAVLSAVLFGINTYSKDYDLGEIAQKHSEAASDLWNIRESYLSIITDLKTGVANIDEATLRRNELQNEAFNVYKGGPRTISRAYTEATKGLKENEELTFTAKEIDQLLPPLLRESSNAIDR